MSLFGAIFGGVKALASRGVIRGSLGRILGGKKKPPRLPAPGGAGGGGRGGLPTIPGAGRGGFRGRLPRGGGRGGGGGIGGGLGQLGGAAAGSAAATLVWNAATQQYEPRPKRKRMNFGNEKALRRALRRVEGFDRLRKRVDKALRKACPPSRRRQTRSRSKPC